MRLLNKNEVQDLKQKERGIEVREGIKLAQKIDVLRETASKEESNLAKFREETLKIIQQEITDLLSQRDILKQEIIDLNEEKRRLRLAIESTKIINNQ